MSRMTRSHPIAHILLSSGVVAALIGAGATPATAANPGDVIAWGDNRQGQSEPFTGASRDIVKIAGSASSLAVKADGTVLAWGSTGNDEGILPPKAKREVSDVAAGVDFSVALKTDGSVVAWGGAGVNPVPAEASSGVSAIAAGRDSIAALKNGAVIAWGDKHNFPYFWTVPEAAKSNVTAISGAGHGFLALKSDGSVISWGRDTSGVLAVPSEAARDVVKIASGDRHALALKKDGSVITWGDISQMTNADGSIFAVGDAAQLAVPAAALRDVTAISAGWNHSLAVKRDGSVIAWGRDPNGLLAVPANLSGVVDVVAGRGFSLALKADGSVTGWGDDASGGGYVPGDATTGVTAVSAGAFHNTALKSDGSVVTWGAPVRADRDAGTYAVPRAARRGVSAISTGSGFMLALREDGRVVAWGFDAHGQDKVPVAAQSGVTAISAGARHSLALKADGSVVAWGGNGYGASTVPPEAANNVIAVSAENDYSMALKADGSIVEWGRGTQDGPTVPEEAMGGIIAIDAKANHQLALTKDYAVVAWGDNTYGQSTVPPAARFDVAAISAGDQFSVALKFDGSVVAWGRDTQGQTLVPAGARSGVSSISAGAEQVIALKAPVGPSIVSPNHTVGTAGSPLQTFQHRAKGNPYAMSWTTPRAVTGATTPGTNVIPAGVTFDRNLGRLTGSIDSSVAAGDYSFTVQASNGVDTDATQIFTLSVAAAPAAPSITSSAEINGTVGESLPDFLFEATGTPSEMTWTAPGANTSSTPGNDAIPAGLTFDATTGTLSGTIDAAVTAGDYTFTVQASNGIKPDATQTLTVHVAPAPVAPTITSADSVSGTVDAALGDFQLTATGTPAVMTWTTPGATTGATTPGADSIPAGLSVDATTGVLSGTIASTVTPGDYTFTTHASNGVNPDAAQTLTVHVAAAPVAPTITSTNAIDARVGESMSFTHTATGNPSVMTWTTPRANASTAPGTNKIPTGLTLDGATGTLAGSIDASAAPGDYTFTVNASNGVDPDAAQSFIVRVAPAFTAPTITSDNTTNARAGDTIAFQHAATGNPNVMTWTTPAAAPSSTPGTNAIPTGLTLDSATGLLSGTLDASATPGDYTFTIHTTNGVGEGATQAFTVHVAAAYAAPTITSTDTVNAVIGQRLPDFHYTASGNPSTMTWSTPGATTGITPGANTIPAGLAIDTAGGTITGTVDASVSEGDYTFTVQASNGVNPDTTQTFTIHVAAAPVAPTVTSTEDTTGRAGEPLSFQHEASGNPSVMAWSAPGATSSTTPGRNKIPAGITLDTATGILSGTIDPTANAGDYTFTVQAANGHRPDGTQTFTVHVEAAFEAPVITSANNTAGTAGDTMATFTHTATGNPSAIVWTAPDANTASTVPGPDAVPAGLVFDSNSGTLSGTIDATAAAGDYTFTIHASNGIGPDATQAFTVHVAAALVAPTITSNGETNGTAGAELGAFQHTATGNPSIMTWTTPGAVASQAPGENTIPTGLSLSTAGILSGTIATSVAAGDYTFTVQASNGTGPDATQTFTVHVAAAPVAPTITSVNTTNGTAGAALPAFQYTATGNPSAMTWTTPGATASSTPGDAVIPSGLTVNSSTGVLTGTIAPSVAAGAYTFTISAANGVGTDATQPFTVTVAAAPAAPTITSTNETHGTIGAALTPFQHTATGNPAAMNWTTPSATNSTTPGANGIPAGLSLDPETGLLAGTIDNTTTPGDYTFTVEASNGVGAAATQHFTVHVAAAPLAPTITSAAETSGTAGSALTPFQYVATGNPAVSGWSALGTNSSTEPGANAIPAGITLDPSTGLLTGTIEASVSAGDYTFTVNATNGIGTDATQTFTVHVAAAPAAPIITSDSETATGAGSQLSFQHTAIGNPSAMTWTTPGANRSSVPGANTIPTGLVLDPVAGTLSGIVAANTAPGAYTFTVQAANGVHPAASQTFTVRVVAAAPTITSAATTTATIGVTMAPFQYTATGNPSVMAWTTPGAVTGAKNPGAHSIPAGLTFDSAAGTLTGTIDAAAAAGDYTFTVNASNGTDPDAEQTFTVRVTAQGAALPDTAIATVPPGFGDTPNGGGLANSGFGNLALIPVGAMALLLGMLLLLTRRKKRGSQI